jgi:hypothetical protein
MVGRRKNMTDNLDNADEVRQVAPADSGRCETAAALPFEVPVADWLSEARRRFGDDPKTWTFECPVCGNRQTLTQFNDIGVEPQYAYQECIGRHMKMRASNLGGTPAKDGTKSPCDYAAYGLFRALKGHVVIPEGGGKPVAVLPFASPTVRDGGSQAK